MENKTFKAVAYNTHLFRKTFIAGVSDFNPFGDSLLFKDDERMTAIIDYLKNTGADVIGLSEVWGTDSKNAISNALKEHGDYKCIIDDSSSSQMGSGLVLLSKHKILDTEFVAFKDAAGDDANAQKGFITCQLWIKGVDPDSWPVVYLTHTQADDAYAETRKLQLEQMKKYQEAQNLSDKTPVVMMGDFNIAADNKEYHVFEQVFPNMLDAYGHVNPQKQGFTCDTKTSAMAKHFNDGDKPHRFDYFFFTEGKCQLNGCQVIKNWQVTVNQSGIDCDHFPKQSNFQLDCSDHYPITAEFLL